MAHSCSPYASPRLVTRSAEWDAGTFLSQLFKNVEAEREAAAVAKNIPGAQREGFIGSFAVRAAKDLRAMSSIPLKEWEQYMAKQGWLDEVDNPLTGLMDYEPALMGAEKTGYAVAVMKTAVESTAGGVKQLADNFLLKVNAGEDAVAEGLQFANQMQTLSKLGSHILGWDQAVGRGLMQSGLIGRAPARAVEGMAEGAAGSIEGQQEYADLFAKIASQLGDPAQMGEGIHELVALAKRVQLLDEPHKISKMSMGMELGGNAWQEMFVNGLLSSPATLATNALSAVWVPMRAAFQLGAASIWAETGLWGATEARQAAAEATAALGAMYSGLGDAFSLGWAAARTDTSIFQKTHRAIGSAPVNTWLGERGMEPLPTDVAGMLDSLGSWVRLPSRGMMGMDEFSKYLAIRGEAAAQGVRQAALAGVSPSDRGVWMNFVRDELENKLGLTRERLMAGYGQGSGALAARDQFRLQMAGYEQGMLGEGGAQRTLTQTANEATFQEFNKISSSINQLLGKAPILRPFIPFIRTPVNILKQGVFESTGITALGKGVGIVMNNPTNAVLAIQQELLKDPAESFRMAGQIAFTTSLMGTLYGMAMGGQITGGGPGRWTEGRAGKTAQDAWVAAGNVPYAFKMGDQWVSFERFGEPIATVLRMAADLGMHSAYMDRDEQDESFAAAVGLVASGMYQASFLKGLETVAKVFQGDADWALGQAIQQWTATQTPFGGLLAFVDRTVDPYRGAYGEGVTFSDMLKVHEGGLGLVFGKVANRIPGVGSNAQLIDQLTGKPVPVVPGIGPGGLNPLQMAIPVMPRNSSVDEVWQAVFEIQGSYQERRPAYKLSAAEQQQLNTLMATTEINGKTLGQRILAFRRRADVNQFVVSGGATMPKARFQIEKELSEIIREHYSQALMKLETTNDEVGMRSRLYDAKALAMEGNDIQGARDVENQLDSLYQRARRGY